MFSNIKFKINPLDYSHMSKFEKLIKIMCSPDSHRAVGLYEALITIVIGIILALFINWLSSKRIINSSTRIKTAAIIIPTLVCLGISVADGYPCTLTPVYFIAGIFAVEIAHLFMLYHGYARVYRAK